MGERNVESTRRKWARGCGCAGVSVALVLVALFYHRMGQMTGEFPLSRAKTERGLGLRLPEGVAVRCLYLMAPPGQYQAVMRMDDSQLLKFVAQNRLHWRAAEPEDDAVREYLKRARLLPELALWEPKPGQALLMDDGRIEVYQSRDPNVLFVRESQKRADQLPYAREVILAYREAEGTYVVLCIVYG